MALDVYFTDDIQQGIVAVSVAMLSAAIAHGGTNLEYCRGVLDLARAQGLNYGIPWSEIKTELMQAARDAERNDLLNLIAKALPSG